MGIVFVQESDDFSVVQGGAGGGRGGGGGGSANYVQSAQGAYQAFFDSNIQADFVGIDDIGEYPMIYLPYPEMLRKATADKLRDYVAKGGKLVSEGCPGIFRRRRNGWRGSAQSRPGPVIRSPRDLCPVHSRPAGEAYSDGEGQADRRPVLLAGVQDWREARRRASTPTATSPPSSTRLAAARLCWSARFPGGSYYRNHAAGTREFFAGLLAWGGIRQQVQSSDPAVKARLHKGEGGTYIWVVNPTRTTRSVKISLPSAFQRAVDLWQESSHPTVSGNTLAVTVEDRNAAVIRLE